MRRHRRVNTEQNLDSFLDIMTNTVGVLLFVLLFVTLSAADATILVKTPMWSPTEKDGVLFEVRGDRVYHLDTDKATGELRQLVASLPRINIFTYDIVSRRIERFTSTTENYQVRFVGALSITGVSLEYSLKTGATGTKVSDLRRADGAYAKVLGSLKPEQNYVAFVVRPDGISAFHTARELALRRGLQVGWEPFEADRALIFGTGGRAIGVQ